MWCSRQNGKLMFYLGVMLLIVGLGFVLLNDKLLGAVLMCVGLFPLVTGFLVMVTHGRLDMKMGPKKAQARKETVEDKIQDNGEKKDQ